MGDHQRRKMTHSDVISNTKTVIQGLEALKNENNTILKGLTQQSYDANETNYLLNQEKAAIIQKTLCSIELGLSEAHIMLALQKHFESVKADNHILKARAKRLTQENEFLRQRLTQTQQKLMEVDKEKITLEQEINSLKFDLSLGETSGRHPSPEGIAVSAPDPVPSNAGPMERSNSTLELGFIDECEDQQSTMSNTTSNSNQVENPSNISFGVSSRIRTLHNLVLNYVKSGRYEVAVPLCKQALEDLEKSSGPNHPDFATMLNILALVYRDQRMYRESIQLLHEALEIREKALGPDDSCVAATLNNLAVLYGKRGSYGEALPLGKRALAIREKLYGPDHPHVAKQLFNLAILCGTLGRSEEVNHYYSKAIDIYEKSLGPNDPEVYKTKNNLASAMYKNNNIKGAERIYKEVISRAHEKEFGKITEDNKPIWQIAEEHDDFKAKRSGKLPTPVEFCKVPPIDETNSPIVQSIKNLIASYRIQGKNVAAEILKDLAQPVIAEPRR